MCIQCVYTQKSELENTQDVHDFKICAFTTGWGHIFKLFYRTDPVVVIPIGRYKIVDILSVFQFRLHRVGVALL